MIISRLSEDRILEELIFDRKIISNEAKKIAKKEIARYEKEGKVGIDNDNELYYTITTGKLHNTWKCLIIVNMKKKPFWTHYAACMVESEMGSKDFYLVRGFSNNEPYFIRFSSHAIKRFKERGVQERLNTEVDFPIEEWAPTLIRKGEIITWMKITDPKFLGIVLDSEDKNIMTTLFYTSYGCYLGYETEGGNFEFKTFLNNNKSLKKIHETEVMNYCKAAHVLLNPSFYLEEIVENVKKQCGDMKDLADKQIAKDYKFKLVP